MTLRLVVARHNEDVSWLHQFLPQAVTVHLYDKGHPISHEDQKEIPSLIHNTLPNVGRESHTYLSYIIDTYDHLASTPTDTTVFVQAGVTSHIPGCSPSEYVLQLANEASTMGFTESLAKHQNCGIEHMPRPEFRIREWPPGTLVTPSKRNESFQPWFERCLAQRFPSIYLFKWCMGGIFGVRHDMITQFPKSYYETLRAEIDHDNNPEEGHYFERSWYYIFHKGLQYFPSGPSPTPAPVPTSTQPKVLLLQIDTRSIPSPSDLVHRYTFPPSELVNDVYDVKDVFNKTHGDALVSTPNGRFDAIKSIINKCDGRRRMLDELNKNRDKILDTPHHKNRLEYHALTSLMNRIQCKKAQTTSLSYEYRQVPEITDRHPSWVKFKTVIDTWDTLQPYDIVIVMDTDAWIRDTSAFEEWLHLFQASDDKSFFFSTEPYSTMSVINGILQQVNGGLTIFKPSEYTRTAIEYIYNMPEAYNELTRFKKDWSYEQICINSHLAKDPVFRDSIMTGPYIMFNTPAGSIVCHCWWKELIEAMIIPEMYAAIFAEK